MLCDAMVEKSIITRCCSYERYLINKKHANKCGKITDESRRTCCFQRYEGRMVRVVKNFKVISPYTRPEFFDHSFVSLQFTLSSPSSRYCSS